MLKPTNKIATLLAFLPLAAFILYILSFVFIFTQLFDNHFEPKSTANFKSFIYVFITGIFLLISTIASLIYFIIHAVDKQFTEKSERIVWIIVFVFAGFIGFPIYWYMRIYKDDRK